MYFSQIWNVGRGGETRCPLSSAPKHCQREGLHLPLVLVHNTLHPKLLGHRLQNHHHHQSQDARLSPLHPVQVDPARSDQHHRQEELRRRLVPLLHVG